MNLFSHWPFDTELDEQNLYVLKISSEGGAGSAAVLAVEAAADLASGLAKSTTLAGWPDLAVGVAVTLAGVGAGLGVSRPNRNQTPPLTSTTARATLPITNTSTTEQIQTLYLRGLGLGWAGMNTDFSSFSQSNAPSFAFQLGAGVNFELTDNISIDVGYRFKDIVGLKFNPSSELIFNDYLQNTSLSSHNVQIGVTFKF